MGSDELFKRRRQQAAADLARRQVNRARGRRLLIVSEGMKTEPYYFKEFCKLHRLHTPRVRIEPGAGGSSPISVVNYAERLFDEDARCGADRYDRVFCVIDRDNHTTFDRALQRIDELKAAGKPFEGIPSYPCFEYWLLLHFKYTRQGFHSAGKWSICDNLIRELRKHPGFGEYAKAQRNTYGRLQGRTETAVENSKRACREAEETGEKNPSTLVHMLVEELLELANTQGGKRSQ